IQAAPPAPQAPSTASGRSSPFSTRGAAQSATPQPTATPAAMTVAQAAAPPRAAGRPMRGEKAPARSSEKVTLAHRRAQPSPHAIVPTSLPGTVEPKVAALLGAIGQLVAVLNEENDALDRHDGAAVRALMGAKTAKTRYYQEQMLGIHANPRLLLDLTEEQRDVMRIAGKTLDTLARENGQRLQANIEATNRFLKAVVTAVHEREKERATCYTPEGAVEGDPTQAYRKAVTFNETL
ncbi:flagellar protein FlgN, partial [Rhodospirillum rubrum]